MNGNQSVKQVTSFDPRDTIVALSSAPGTGARAIVRLSGPNAVALVVPFWSGPALVPPQRALLSGTLSLADIHGSLPADVEAALDFADEDIRFVGQEETLKRLAAGLAQLTLLKKQLEQRAVSERPFRAVLAGRPNAGKSSLFNALTGAAALVSPQPG